MRRGGLVLVVLLSLAFTTPARAVDPAYPAREAADRVYAEGRGVDQQVNPAYILRTAPQIVTYFRDGDPSILVDPFRQHWNGTRGVSVPISFVNRYGATLRGHLWRPNLPWHDPVTGVSTNGPLPAVVVLPGFGGDDTSYYGLIQQLAESGYVVLSFAPQGAAPSDIEPNPKSTYCDPNGSWRQPQEVGITEQGPCAGEDPPNTGEGDPTLNNILSPLYDTPLGSAASVVASAPLLLQAHTDPEGTLDGIAPEYAAFRPRFVFGALDAVAWLRSNANPWRSLVDLDHVGVAGHSAGSDGALVAGNGDPLHRFAAAVAWDDYGDPPPGMSPTVPTMIQQSEQENLMGPFLTAPSPTLFHSYRIATAFRRAGVDAMLVALRGSTHQEWTYIPYSLINPLAPLFNASARGQEVAAYYTLAWFDRYLKAGNAADAAHRLTANRFDDSSDRSSIGSGHWDAVHQVNVPYKIARESVRDMLSSKFLSLYSFGGKFCGDLARGCPASASSVLDELARIGRNLGDRRARDLIGSGSP
ncbi:MAG: hypothetical protein QOI98_1356 [Solirubrobacteraceae bacterium]|nr:hypothetical protein [Solirubrobacteraceae bacterium]